MDNVINLAIPYVGEHIFESMSSDDLVQCFAVSRAWKMLAENILYKRWKGKFFEACVSGKGEIVGILLKHLKSEEIETQLKKKDDCGRTAFMWVCCRGHKNIVELSLHHPSMNEQIDFSARDPVGETAFMMACRSGHKNIVEIFLNHSIISEQIDFNARALFGMTAFIFACVMGNKDVVALLLEHPSSSKQIDFDAEDSFGQTGFMKTKQDDIRTLLQNDPKVNTDKEDPNFTKPIVHFDDHW